MELFKIAVSSKRESDGIRDRGYSLMEEFRLRKGERKGKGR